MGDTVNRSEIFARSIAFWGADRQELLAGKSVFVAGVGALGAIVAQILVRSGVGEVLIADRGRVDPPDLNRQSLYTVSDLGELKVQVAARRLEVMTGLSRIVPLNISIGEDDLTGFLSACDCIADCLDNFPSRFALEEAQPPESFMVSGAILGNYGQITTIVPGKTVSLKKLFATVKDKKRPTPVVPTIVFAMGSFMAQEILACLSDEPLAGEILAVGMSGFFLERVPVSPA